MIEIIEFYPLERDEAKDSIVGHLRIKLLESGIHILGIVATKRKDTWYFLLPGQSGTHHETRERVRFPYICFEDREKHRLLMEHLREKGRAFIEDKLANRENPLIFPEKPLFRKCSATTPHHRNKPTKEFANKKESTVYSTKTSSSTKKVFFDLPPRNKTSQNPFHTVTKNGSNRYNPNFNNRS